MSRWVYLLGLYIAVVGLAFGLTTHLMQEPIGPATYWRIRPSMTEQEVESAVGTPPLPDDPIGYGLAPRESLELVHGRDHLDYYAGLHQRRWRGRHWMIVVTRDRTGEIVFCNLYRITRTGPHSLAARLRSFLGW